MPILYTDQIQLLDSVTTEAYRKNKEVSQQKEMACFRSFLICYCVLRVERDFQFVLVSRTK